VFYQSIDFQKGAQKVKMRHQEIAGVLRELVVLCCAFGVDLQRTIIESSLPLNLTRREHRLAFAKRLYAGELPDAALLAYAEWNG
jgi:hypothetical protein